MDISSVDTEQPTETQTEQPTETQTEQPTEGKTIEMNIMDVPVNNTNIALNVMVFFLNQAQRRGVYTIDESAKIWEAVKMFIVNKDSKQTIQMETVPEVNEEKEENTLEQP